MKNLFSFFLALIFVGSNVAVAAECDRAKADGPEAVLAPVADLIEEVKVATKPLVFDADKVDGEDGKEWFRLNIAEIMLNDPQLGKDAIFVNPTYRDYGVGLLTFEEEKCHVEYSKWVNELEAHAELLMQCWGEKKPTRAEATVLLRKGFDELIRKQNSKLFKILYTNASAPKAVAPAPKKTAAKQ